MTTFLVFLALCLLWGLQIVIALCQAAKREPDRVWGDAQSQEIEVSGQGATKVAMAQLRTPSHPATKASPPIYEILKQVPRCQVSERLNRDDEAATGENFVSGLSPSGPQGRSRGQSQQHATAHTLTLSSPQELL
jgi:hypothetical protein